MRFILSAAAASLALVGCAGSPVRALSAKPEQLGQYSNGIVCDAFHLAKSDKIRNELEARNVLNADEWQAVNAGQAYVGMSVLALVCAWGEPDRTNTTATQSGAHYQLVYGLFDVRRYVYVEKGFVVAIQD